MILLGFEADIHDFKTSGFSTSLSEWSNFPPYIISFRLIYICLAHCPLSCHCHFSLWLFNITGLRKHSHLLHEWQTQAQFSHSVVPKAVPCRRCPLFQHREESYWYCRVVRLLESPYPFKNSSVTWPSSGERQRRTFCFPLLFKQFFYLPPVFSYLLHSSVWVWNLGAE